jgi:hypothetical protein
MHLLQTNENLNYVRDLLGQADIQTAEIYERADTEMKRKALEKDIMKSDRQYRPSGNKIASYKSGCKALGKSKAHNCFLHLVN